MKFIICWDTGCGESCDIIEVSDLEEAQGIAYEAWKEESESQADYSAMEYSEELAENKGL